jgi:hypothetical protein
MDTDLHPNIRFVDGKLAHGQVFVSGPDALARFADADPHRELVRKLAPAMGSTRFVRWTMREADGRPSWDDALQRLR